MISKRGAIRLAVSVFLSAGSVEAAQGPIDPDGPPSLFDALQNLPVTLADVTVLLDAGADPNARNEVGWPPLYHMGVVRNPAIVEALIAAGADPNARVADGSTPLHAAAQFGTPASIEILVAAGADLNARDEDGWTPLYFAAGLFGAPANIEALVAAGADPNARNEGGRAPPARGCGGSAVSRQPGQHRDPRSCRCRPERTG